MLECVRLQLKCFSSKQNVSLYYLSFNSIIKNKSRIKNKTKNYKSCHEALLANSLN